MIGRRRQAKSLTVLLLLFLTACSAAAPPTSPIWKRVDGRAVGNDPKLMQQWEIDKAICAAEVQKANLSSPVYVQRSNYPTAGNVGESMSQFGDALGNLAREGQAIENKQAALMQVLAGCMATRGYVRIQ